jgi:hypothetical protein
MKPGIRFFPTLIPLALLLLAPALRPTGATADIGEIGNYNTDAFTTSEVHPRSGKIANSTPLISPVRVPDWTSGEYSFTATDGYSIHARVLSKKHYALDRESQLSPYDLALGWQDMSDSDVIRRIDISQSDRWYHYHWSGAPPMAPDAMPLESGNMHIIPANDEVLRNLRKLAKGNVIFLEGYLVNVHASDGWLWKSATGSNSSGPHGCKVIWVTKIVIER